MLILSVIYLEKYLLTILAAAACYILIPAGCSSLLVNCFFPSGMLKSIGTKLITSADMPSLGGVYKLAGVVEDGKIIFNADSDAIITKGIISLLIGLYSGRTAEEILSSDFSVVEKIGLKENLSPTRANGLVSMIAKIREVALNNE